MSNMHAWWEYTKYMYDVLWKPSHKNHPIDQALYGYEAIEPLYV